MNATNERLPQTFKYSFLISLAVLAIQPSLEKDLKTYHIARPPVRVRERGVREISPEEWKAEGSKERKAKLKEKLPT